MEEEKELGAKTESASGKSGSAEEIGFGLTQKDKGNEGKEAVGGSEGGRQRGGVGMGVGRRDKTDKGECGTRGIRRGRP